MMFDSQAPSDKISSAAIGFLQQLQRIPDTKIKGPFLVVAPLSLVSQWESETREWAPDMNCIVYHGSADARDFLAKNEFWHTEQFAPRAVCSELKREVSLTCLNMPPCVQSNTVPLLLGTLRA